MKKETKKTKMECKQCKKKDVKIKELQSVISGIKKKNREQDKYVKYTIADILRSINAYNINEVRRKLKELGGVQQYHNYPQAKMPEKPKQEWIGVPDKNYYLWPF